MPSTQTPYKTLVERLFPMPGSARSAADHVLAHAGSAHARLLDAAACSDTGLSSIAAPITAYLKGPASAAAKRRLLGAPQLIEALHAIAPACPALRDWDRSDNNSPHSLTDRALALGLAKLGNVTLPLVLAADPAWCGCVSIAASALGRIAFADCPWTIVLRSLEAGQTTLLADEVVRLTLRGDECALALARGDPEPILVMHRVDFRRLLSGSGRLNLARMAFPHPNVRPHLARAPELGTSGIRFEAVSCDHGSHDPTTGAILRSLIRATARNAPAIYTELCAFIRTIRGFDLPRAEAGLVQSFSTPAEPGVIGFNVSYAGDRQPQLSPLCFTWLGHELGHTKHYLIDDLAYAHHWRFLLNPDESTGHVPRYQRALWVRTLFQIPYVHLYEWALLMDFAAARFRGLPWRVEEDWHAAGEEIAAEIREAFDLIAERARLTALGVAALDHLRRLAAEAQARWQRLR